MELPSDATRARVLAEITQHGPISAASIAETLGLTQAGVRRHLVALEEQGVIDHRSAHASEGRGRPPRAYVLTRKAHERLDQSYARVAADALTALEREGGVEMVQSFANAQVAPREAAWSAELEGIVGTVERAEKLAVLLSRDGYAATLRPVAPPRGTTPGSASAATPSQHLSGSVQLCQGHCPIQDIAAQYPQFCEAEAQAFTRLLGVPVQRLLTLAHGGHACTTHVPVNGGKPL